jgi:hypothetical protein
VFLFLFGLIRLILVRFVLKRRDADFLLKKQHEEAEVDEIAVNQFSMALAGIITVADGPPVPLDYVGAGLVRR